MDISEKMAFNMADVRKVRNKLLNIDRVFEGMKKSDALESKGNTEREMLMDIGHALNGIESVMVVFEEKGTLDKGYATEKLNASINILQHIKNYYSKNK